MEHSESIRAMVSDLRRGGLIVRTRYPTWARLMIADYARKARAAGATCDEIAATLDVSPNSIARWSRAPEVHGDVCDGFVPVELESRGDETSSPPQSIATLSMPAASGGARPAATLVVVSPAGYRLEGLAATDAVPLFRALP